MIQVTTVLSNVSPFIIENVYDFSPLISFDQLGLLQPPLIFFVQSPNLVLSENQYFREYLLQQAQNPLRVFFQ